MKDRKPVTNEELREKMAKVSNKALDLLEERGAHLRGATPQETRRNLDAALKAEKKAKPKRPRDLNQLAKSIVDSATKERPPLKK